MAGISITWTASSANYDISAQGFDDWALWNSGSGSGTTVAPSQRKSGGGSTIGSMTRTVATLDGFNATTRTASWTGGTPTASGSNTNGLFNTLNASSSSTAGADCSVTLPADTTTREAKFYFEAYSSAVTLTCTLSDGSAGPTTNTSLDTGSVTAQSIPGYYTITYSAGSAGQTLTVKAVATTARFSFSDVEPQGIGYKALSGGTTVTPGQAAVTLAGQVPTLAQTANQGVSPSQAAVAFSGPAPTIAQTSGQTVAPAAGSLAFAGQAPTLAQTANQGLSPTQAALTLSGQAPTVQQSNGLTVSPAAGAVSFAGQAPGIAQSANQAVVPGAGSVALQGAAPTIAQSANQAVSPGAGALSFQGFAPTFTQASASVTVTPDVGVLTFAGFAPDVLQSGGAGGYSDKPRKKRFLNQYIREIPSEPKQEPEVVETPAPKPKVVQKVERIVQKIIEADDEDEIEALMLLL